MRLSILTALYNCLPHTQAMLASLRATLPAGLDWEIVLVDDGSTDGTREWIASLPAAEPRIRILLQPENGGFAAANNRAAAVATGEVFALLNNDLVFTPGWIEPMLAALAGHPDAALVGNVQTTVATGAIHHTGLFINARGKPEHDRTIPSADGVSGIRPVACVTAACALIRHDVFTQLGGFDAAFRNGHEDVDLCLRARAAHLRCYVALNSSVAHHVSASPNRSLNKIRNAARSMNRWQNVLPDLAAETWCDPHLRPIWERRLPWPSRLRARFVHSGRGIDAPTCPAWLRSSVRHSIDRQLKRWRRDLGGTLPT